jgi:hypothetical protein
MNTLSAENRFALAEEQIIDRGIVFNINPPTCCTSCIDLNTVGGRDGDEYAIAFYGNMSDIDTENAKVEWGPETLFISSWAEETVSDCSPDCNATEADEDGNWYQEHTYESDCAQGTPEKIWVEKEWHQLLFNFSSLETGRTLVEVFKSNGFRTDWNGTIHDVVSVFV